MSITILDENDNSPEFDITSDTSVGILENTPIGNKVAVVLGRDKDAGNNGMVRREERRKAGKGSWRRGIVLSTWDFEVVMSPFPSPSFSLSLSFFLSFFLSSSGELFSGGRKHAGCV